MSQNEVEAALDNLQAIKQGKDPREKEAQPEAESNDPLKMARAEVDRLFEEHDLDEYLPRERLHVAICEWQTRWGQAKYHTVAKKDRYGKQVRDSQLRDARGSHSIFLSKHIWNHGPEWIDTVRHEVAHVIAYVDRKATGHGDGWKLWARRLGAEPTACANKELLEGQYVYACPNGCWRTTKQRLSKKIKRPWSNGRYCSNCEATPVSYDNGHEPPEEEGVCAVSDVPWRTKEEYRKH